MYSRQPVQLVHGCEAVADVHEVEQHEVRRAPCCEALASCGVRENPVQEMELAAQSPYLACWESCTYEGTPLVVLASMGSLTMMPVPSTLLLSEWLIMYM